VSLPEFRYHPDPLASGSVVASEASCTCCGQARGYIYAGPVYAEDDLTALCPWCIADGSAHEKCDATFFDEESCDEDIPARIIEEICERTPGYATWQQGAWPVCCGDATAFVTPLGSAEIRAKHPSMEGLLMSYIVHDMLVSGGAATRLLNALHIDKGPTAYLFRCLHCEAPHFHIDQP
jgi:uncharacterized protein